MKQFIIEQEPDGNGMLTLSDKAFVYLVKVRRMREGDILSALLPQSGAADMIIDSINTVKKTLRVKRQTAHAMLAPLPAAELILLQWERFWRIIKEARQQSGSPVDTVVMEPTPLAEALNTLKTLVPAATTAFALCSEAVGTSVGFHQLLAEKPSHIVLAIGAEGGISPAESAALREAAFQTVHFKTNVLRAETAALYAIAAAQTTINEADQWQLPV